jgi:Zn-dependent protease with chaperone function
MTGPPNDRSLSAQLAPQQSKALVALTAAIAGAVIVALLTLGDAAASLVTWCRHFVIVASTDRAIVVGAVVAALGGLALASAINLLAFLISETVTALRLSSRIAHRTVPTPGRAHAALVAAHVDAATIVVDDAVPFAVSIGMLSPRIVLSTGLLSTMTLAELRAVFAHESGHVRLRHPLRAVAWEAIRRTLFFLPVIGDVAAHFALAREIAADRHAVKACGQRPLASALLKIVSGSPQSFPLSSAPFGHLHSRIDALRGGKKTELRMSLRRMQMSLAVIGVIATANVAMAASAKATAPGGARCVSEDVPHMSQINFSPYFSIRVPPMSPMPAAALDDLRTTVPVQSSAVRP